MQIFAHFERKEIVWKLEPTRIFAQDCKIIIALMLKELKHAPWVQKFELGQRVSHGVWLEGHEIQKLELQNLILMKNLKLYKNMHQWKFPTTQYV